jgi:CheY-like chemotaxis protein
VEFSEVRNGNLDDNDQNRYSISRVLKEAGFDVIEAKTGREALDLASCRPSLVILDINLPDMIGLPTPAAL